MSVLGLQCLDEQRVLSGLRRQLHPRRTEWEMAFADGGEAALALLRPQAGLL